MREATEERNKAEGKSSDGRALALRFALRVGLPAVREHGARGIEDGGVVEEEESVGTTPSRGGSQRTSEGMRVVGKHASRGESEATSEQTKSENVAIEAGGDFRKSSSTVIANAGVAEGGGNLERRRRDVAQRELRRACVW